MFLVEYNDGEFIDATKIDWICLRDENIEFSITQNKSCFFVSRELSETFINHLQALNSSISSIENRFNQINRPEMKVTKSLS